MDFDTLHSLKGTSHEDLEMIQKRILALANPLDARILIVLKDVAYGELCSDDMSSWCPHGECRAWDSSAKYGSAVHDPDCPVTLARQVLSEVGEPILLYRIDWECFDGRVSQWTPASTSYRIAFSEEEVRLLFVEHTDLKVKGILRRNVQVACMGEAQEVLREDKEEV